MFVATAFVLSNSAAWAVIDVNKSFAPINIFPGQTSTVTINLFNSQTLPATSATFTDTLPANVIATSVLSNTCGGTLSITPSTQVSLSGGTVPAGTGANSGTCAVSVVVTSATPGAYVNTVPVGGVSTSLGSNPGAASATLTVATVLGLTGSKSFSPSTIHVTGLSTLTITLTNPNIGALTNATFTDTLPTPLLIASPLVTGGRRAAGAPPSPLHRCS